MPVLLFDQQGKILIEVLVNSSLGPVLKALLRLGEGFKGNEALMARRPHNDAPSGHLDVARIEHLREKNSDALIAHPAILQLAGKLRLHFEKCV